MAKIKVWDGEHYQTFITSDYSIEELTSGLNDYDNGQLDLANDIIHMINNNTPLLEIKDYLVKLYWRNKHD